MTKNDLIFDLSNIEVERYFVVGELRGCYDNLINLLHVQNFTYKDVLITTGNILDIDNPRSLDLLYFIKNNNNCYSIKGRQEFDILNLEDKPKWYENDLSTFIEELPLVIKITDNLYVVNTGVEPHKSFEDQNIEVFYNIDEYDKDSRFYQFENPEKKSWYEFEFHKDNKLVKFCFGLNVVDITVPAGYALGRDVKNNKSIKCLIVTKQNADTPILVENF